MQQHVDAVHFDLRPFVCSEPGCTQSFSTSGALRTHVMRWHTGEKPHKCDMLVECGSEPCVDPYCEHKRCDFAATTKGELKSHQRRRHTAEGCRITKQKEHKLQMFLEKEGLLTSKDSQLHIPVKGCGLDGGRHRAFLDFVIHTPNKIVIVENDEFQHAGDSVTCDPSRMNDVVGSARIAGEKLGLLFIRFNPDSFKVDGKTRKTFRKEREALLLRAIHEVDVEREQWGVLYMFYDEVSGTPEVTRSFDYPREHMPVIQWEPACFGK